MEKKISPGKRVKRLSGISFAFHGGSNKKTRHKGGFLEIKTERGITSFRPCRPYRPYHPYRPYQGRHHQQLLL